MHLLSDFIDSEKCFISNNEFIKLSVESLNILSSDLKLLTDCCSRRENICYTLE